MNVRELALRVINDVNIKQAYANIVLNKLFPKHQINEQDRRFITELAYGTIKVGKTLDWILNRYIDVYKRQARNRRTSFDKQR